MTKVIILVAALCLLVAAIKVAEFLMHRKAGGRKSRFEYGRKDFLMTRAEHECFDALVAGMGADYYFFPQIHLDAIVFPQNAGSGRLYAFRHINQKSVDFVGCDKRHVKPVFVIELDDKTHNQPSRMERDREVERILRGAGIPLVRIENRGRFEPRELARMVQGQIQENSAQK